MNSKTNKSHCTLSMHLLPVSVFFFGGGGRCGGSVHRQLETTMKYTEIYIESETSLLNLCFKIHKF